MKLVLIRHGESQWNLENRFTGWKDVDLSPKGMEEAKAAGKALKEMGLVFDVAYTSYLKRAIKTLNFVLEEMDELYIPVNKSWRLNERHYGALQGLNKAETAKKYGDEQVHIWRRSFDIAPPSIDETSEYYPKSDRRYADLADKDIPLGESLKDTIARVLPYWHSDISKSLEEGKNVIVAAHGNSLRALIKYLLNISDEEILNLNLTKIVEYYNHIQKHEESLDLAGQMVLRLIKAADSLPIRKLEFLQSASSLNEWLISQSNEQFVHLINRWQIMARQNVLTRDIQENIRQLRSSPFSEYEGNYADHESLRVKIRFACSVLLEDKKEADFCLQKLDNSDQKLIQTWPIWSLYQALV